MLEVRIEMGLQRVQVTVINHKAVVVQPLALQLHFHHIIVTVKPAAVTQAEDDDFAELNAQLRVDLNRYNSREIARKPTATPTTSTARARDKEFADRAKALFAPITSLVLRLPVVGIRVRDLSDSWHDPRDGGVRVHKGIDIFAPRGTEVVAAADGIVSYIGDQPKGGHCLWVTTESGTSFYYAHLDRWAPGLYEGMEVQAGDLLGALEVKRQATGIALVHQVGRLNLERNWKADHGRGSYGQA